MKKKWTINIDDVPSNITIEKFIRHKTDIELHITNLKSISKHPNYVSASLDIQGNSFITKTLSSLAKYNSYNFEYQGREEKFESYLSTSLTHNPFAIDKMSDDLHQSGLGSKIYNSGNSDYYESIEAAKNTYADTYSFNQKTPLAQEEEPGNFLSSFQRSLIRSRISIIKANSEESTKLQYLWHKDESIFLNLRVNIPLQSNENYVIQILDDEANSADISEFELIPGRAFVYNTQKLHRPFCKIKNAADRINMICGVSPWFDYDHENRTWVSNDFYGELHPFDMFISGNISTLIKV